MEYPHRPPRPRVPGLLAAGRASSSLGGGHGAVQIYSEDRTSALADGRALPSYRDHGSVGPAHVSNIVGPEESRSGVLPRKDRISSLPDPVLRIILGLISPKEAARAYILSRRWGALAPPPTDWISDLPIEVLSSILDLIPLIGAVRTCKLSTKWREVWKYLPSLRFTDVGIKVLSFNAFVDGTLNGHCQEIDVDRFEIKITESKNVDGARLSEWAAHAAERATGVIKFSLSLKSEYNGQPLAVELPCHANAQSLSLTISDPEDIQVMLGEAGVFSQLTMMSLKGVRFAVAGTSLSYLVSTCCPVLSQLFLSDVRGFNTLDLKSESLEKVKIKFATDLHSITIFGGKLQTLEVGHNFWGKKSTVLWLETPEIEVLKWEDSWPQLFQISATWLEKRVLRKISQVQVPMVGHHFRQSDLDEPVDTEPFGLPDNLWA